MLPVPYHRKIDVVGIFSYPNAQSANTTKTIIVLSVNMIKSCVGHGSLMAVAWGRVEIKVVNGIFGFFNV